MPEKEELINQLSRKKLAKRILLCLAILFAVMLIASFFLRWESRIDKNYGNITIRGTRVNYVYKTDCFTELIVTIDGVEYDLVYEKLSVQRSVNCFSYEYVRVLGYSAGFWYPSEPGITVYMDSGGDWYVIKITDGRTFVCSEDTSVSKEQILERCGLG